MIRLLINRIIYVIPRITAGITLSVIFLCLEIIVLFTGLTSDFEKTTLICNNSFKSYRNTLAFDWSSNCSMVYLRVLVI